MEMEFQNHDARTLQGRPLKPHRSSIIERFGAGKDVVVEDPSTIPDYEHAKDPLNDARKPFDAFQRLRPETSSWWKKLELSHLYRVLLYNRLKGDKAKLTMFTIVIMLASEIPIYFFTMLDFLKLESLFKYRLHYIQDLTEHLGVRNYPPNSLTLKTAKNALFNFYFAYLLPAAAIMKLGTKLGIYIYDTEATPENQTMLTSSPVEVLDETENDLDTKTVKNDRLTWARFIKEFVILAILADFGFYGVHRSLHTKLLYKDYHKKHHEFKYAIALSHHWMEYLEAIMFGIPQVVPPIAYLLVTGKRMHVTSMWAGIFFSQLNSILGHAGYRIPFIPRWFPCFQADFHDFHHVDYKVNYGAIFPFIDKLFGTYFHPGIESDVGKVLQNVGPKRKF